MVECLSYFMRRCFWLSEDSKSRSFFFLTWKALWWGWWNWGVWIMSANKSNSSSKSPPAAFASEASPGFLFSSRASRLANSPEAFFYNYASKHFWPVRTKDGETIPVANYHHQVLLNLELHLERIRTGVRQGLLNRMKN